jgi:hypothetical protein
MTDRAFVSGTCAPDDVSGLMDQLVDAFSKRVPGCRITQIKHAMCSVGGGTYTKIVVSLIIEFDFEA